MSLEHLMKGFKLVGPKNYEIVNLDVKISYIFGIFCLSQNGSIDDIGTKGSLLGLRQKPLEK